MIIHWILGPIINKPLLQPLILDSPYTLVVQQLIVVIIIIFVMLLVNILL